MANIQWKRPRCNRQRNCYIMNVALISAIGLTCGMFESFMLRKWNESNTISMRNSTLEGNGSTCKDHKIAKNDTNRIRVLCMIVTMPRNRVKSIGVRETWARRCTTYYFVSSEVDPSLPSIAAVKNESREMLWQKTVYAIKHAAENYLHDHDYFLKADDDTYMIMENLRELLSKHDPNEPVLMGRRFRPFAKQGYTSGGAGYVLSRAGLQHVYKRLLNDDRCSQSSHGAEDVNLDHRIAEDNTNRIRVLCMIVTMTSPRLKAMSVRETWTKRCTTHYFVSSEVDPSLQSIPAVENESRAMLWPKTVYAIKHAMEHYSNDHDYFLKADDDTYMIMENLRKLLSEHDPTEPMLMGHRFMMVMSSRQFQRCNSMRKSFRMNIILSMALGLACGTLLSFIRRKWDILNTSTLIDRFSSEEQRSACEDHRIAEDQTNRIRVLCMILTMPRNRMKSISVRETWAKRCTTYYFVSSEVDPSLPSLAAVNNETQGMLWPKTVYAIKHAMKYYSTDHDYFLKADDDTYMIMENLRKLLSEHDPTEPMLMGRRFRPFAKQGYPSGGASYVLSRAGLQHIYEGLINNGPCSKYRNSSEDINLGRCAEAMKVPLIDSLDQKKLERFHPFPPWAMMSTRIVKPIYWVVHFNYHAMKTMLMPRRQFRVYNSMRKSRKINIILSIAIGLACGTLLSFIRRKWDRSNMPTMMNPFSSEEQRSACEGLRMLQ